MSKIKFYFISLVAAITIISCNKDDDNDIEITPPRDHTEQYKTESALIETYLKTNYITVVDAPGQTTDQDVKIGKLDAENPISIWEQTKYPLLSREVKLHGVTYKLYYLVLREGVGEKPCNVDGVFTSYNGKYLEETTVDNSTSITATQFDEEIYPESFINLSSVIRGWREIFPQFKTGVTTSNPENGTLTYENFGAGVIFIPSGLAYYNTGNGSIPGYVPLVFNFKLYEIKRSDLEYAIRGSSYVSNPDGVLSFQEDINGDGYLWTNAELEDGVTVNPDDTDRDGTPDFLDFDDDGDGVTTSGEIKDAFGNDYSYDAIPDCSGYPTSDRTKKRHVDATCKVKLQ